MHSSQKCPLYFVAPAFRHSIVVVYKPLPRGILHFPMTIKVFFLETDRQEWVTQTEKRDRHKIERDGKETQKRETRKRHRQKRETQTEKTHRQTDRKERHWQKRETNRKTEERDTDRKRDRHRKERETGRQKREPDRQTNEKSCPCRANQRPGKGWVHLFIPARESLYQKTSMAMSPQW